MPNSREAQALAAAETGRGLGGVEYAGGMQAELLAAASGGLSGAALFETLVGPDTPAEAALAVRTRLNNIELGSV